MNEPQVTLPQRADDDNDAALIERLERERREYFVAMTRAPAATTWVRSASTGGPEDPQAQRS